MKTAHPAVKAPAFTDVCCMISFYLSTIASYCRRWTTTSVCVIVWTTKVFTSTLEYDNLLSGL
jgi:hypothetical protein